MPNAFRCARTGLYFPEDYVEQWGRKYGIGLGPVPVSECLTNRYDIDVVTSRESKGTMHPVGVCRAQMDFVQVTETEFRNKTAIAALEDVDMRKRAIVMRERQIVHDAKMQALFPEEATKVLALEANKAKRKDTAKV